MEVTTREQASYDPGPGYSDCDWPVGRTVPAAPTASNCRSCNLLNRRGNADDGIWMDCTGRVQSMSLPVLPEMK